MSEREKKGNGSADGPGSRLLFIVARGHAGLRAGIERALRGLPGVEVIQDRRRDGTLLSRAGREPSGATTSSPSEPDPDHPTGPAPTSAITRVPMCLPHRV